jgi:hypothetical protein
MTVGGRRAMLGASLVGAVVVAGSLLSGASAGRLAPAGLTPAERTSMRIASVRATGAEGAGLVVTVTFRGNLEKTIGRGNLKNALVAVILRPKDSSFKTADIATEGAGAIGLTSKKTRSNAVGVIRNGRVFTFFIAGPGSSNVAEAVVKTFRAAPGRKPARTTSGVKVAPSEWEQIENGLADDEIRAQTREVAAGIANCGLLRQMYAGVLADIARSRARSLKLFDLRRDIDAAIQQAQGKIGAHVEFAAVLMKTIYAPIGVGFALLTGKTFDEDAQSWKEVLRELEVHRRIAVAYKNRNDDLIERLLELKGRLEGLIEKCQEGGTQTQPTPAKTFNVGLKTSYTHPGGDTSTLCARVGTTPPKPGSGVTVTVTGPGVVGPSRQTRTLDDAGGAVVDFTINAYGTYSFSAAVSAGDETETASASQVVTKTQATCPPP